MGVKRCDPSNLIKLLNSIGATMFGCICVFAFIDLFAFRNADPISFLDITYALYPTFTSKRSYIKAVYDDIHPFTQFIYGDVSINAGTNSNNSLTSIELNLLQKGNIAYNKFFLMNNETIQNYNIINKNSITYDKVSLQVDYTGDITEDSTVKVKFQFGSYKFFYRKLFFKVTFFLCSLAFLLLNLRNSFKLNFRYLSTLFLIILSCISNNPFTVISHSKSVITFDCIFHRLFHSFCRIFLAIYLLNMIPLSNVLYIVITISISFCDILFGIFEEVLFSLQYNENPTNFIKVKVSALDIIVMTFYFAELIFVFVFADKSSFMSLFGFALLSLNEILSLLSERNLDRGILYLIAIAIPNIFSYDYIGYGKGVSDNYEFGNGFYLINGDEEDSLSEIEN